MSSPSNAVLGMVAAKMLKKMRRKCEHVVYA
jgi:hypothetical protein